MKKGFWSLEVLLDMLKDILPTMLVIAIVIGGMSIIWRATQKEAPDQDMKRMLDATDALIEQFSNKKISTDAYYTVGITSDKPMQVAFYPEGGYAMPPACRGRSCLCIYYITSGGKKETCKPIDIKGRCTQETCGGELCAGDYTEFNVQKGEAVKFSVACTDKGTQLMVEEVA